MRARPERDDHPVRSIMSSNGAIKPREGYMAGDSQELLAKKLWIEKEWSLIGNPIPSMVFSKRSLLSRTMSEADLVPDPPHAPAASHLRGRPRYEWARFAGDPVAGTDPLLGYNARWAEARSKLSTPFSRYRTASSAQLAMAAGVEKLTIKPVDRSKLPKKLKPLSKSASESGKLHKVMSLEDLAGPDVPERPKKRWADSGQSVNDSTIASIAFRYN